MTDAQFNVLIGVIAAGLGGLATVIKWSVSILTKSLDTNTQAHLESVKVMTAMSTKLDFVYQATGKVDQFIKEEISGVHDTDDVRRLSRAKTNPGER